MKVYAIIVAYHPRVDRLLEMSSILNRLDVKVIIADNSMPPVSKEPLEGLRLVSCGDNIGIAAAQNIGVRIALGEGADTIIFFDQDSRINAELVTHLLSGLGTNSPRIVGPAFHDEQRGYEYPAIRFNRWGVRSRVYPSHHCGAVEVSAIISSGCAVNRSALEKIGLMDESLFIDYVDTEWCLRAGKLGIPIQILPQAKMLHSIGDRSINLGFIRVPVHSAQRRYYRVRNSILLLGMPHVPKLLALRELAFSFVHQTVIMLAVPGRRDYLRYFIRALVDGFRGKTGKM